MSEGSHVLHSCFAIQACVFFKQNNFLCFSHKIKCQVPYEFTFTNVLGVLYHYPLNYMYMTLKYI